MRAVDSEAAVNWLLQSDEPAVRYLIRRDVLEDQPTIGADLRPRGPKASALLSGQQTDGGLAGNPYRKFTGAHWR
jgi:hypothetical protein